MPSSLFTRLLRPTAKRDDIFLKSCFVTSRSNYVDWWLELKVGVSIPQSKLELIERFPIYLLKWTRLNKDSAIYKLLYSKTATLTSLI